MEKIQKRINLEQMLHPAGGYEHPNQVLRDSDLTLNEKRSVLAAWVSDACAVEAKPALRLAPGGRPVTVDDILSALRELDRQAGGQATCCRRYRKAVRDHQRMALSRSLEGRANSTQTEGRATP